jgi:hypothetical protein
MKRISCLSALLALVGCATLLPQNPPAGLPAQVPAPNIQVGDRWSYAVHDGYTKLPKGTVEYRVSAVAGDIVTTEVRHRERVTTEHYTRDGGWREKPMTNLQNFHYDPPYPALPFPLEAGKSWRAYVKATDPATGRTNRVRIDGTVLGWERIRVPAGEFDAIKVRRVVYAGNFDYFRSEERIVELDWYSPQVGMLVKMERSSEYYDARSGCGNGGLLGGYCGPVSNDWNVSELVGRQDRRAGGTP